MKVGDYVRTIRGRIYRLTENDLKFEMTKQTCKISSPNIIDLIEVGDYVNGGKVICKYDYILGFDGGQDGEYYINEGNIESIVTKEQFESMEYKIGD